MSSNPSQSLLPRIAEGDRRAVADCLDRYGNLVWSLATRFLRNRAEAEDAVQEIFIDLWAKAGSFDAAKASETTFIAMVARRRLIDRMRRTKREPTTEDLESAAEAGIRDGTASLEAKTEAARTSRPMASLTQEQRQVIKLSVYDGYSHQSIADRLGMPLGAVKTHLRRGLLKIREGMRRRGPRTDGGTAT